MPLYVRIVQITGLPEDVERARRDHETHVEKLGEAGRLRVAGEFPGGEGYLEIFEARDRLDAERTASASALVRGGHATWILREWVERGQGPG